MSSPIEVTWDNANVTRALQQLINKTSNPEPFLRSVGEELSESSKQRFVFQTGPDGQRWERNSDATIAIKGRNQPLTGETGKLQDEIDYDMDGRDGVVIYGPMEYAAMQQFGGTKEDFPWLWGDIPARPFFGISDDDEQMIFSVLSDFLS